MKLSEARYGFVPKFYGQDSAVIVDTDKITSTPLQTNKISLNYPTKLRLPPPFPLWQHFPRYHIIPPPPPGQIISINTWPKTKFSTTTTSSTTTEAPTTTSSSTSTTTTSTTTTTTTTPPPTSSVPLSINTNKFRIDTVPFVTDDEFPRELLDIAQHKLGLKSLDEIPSISELGQLLGTNSPQETLSYIRKLTSNEQGVALMKAYIESTDYTDNADKSDDDDEDNDDDDYVDAPINLSDINGPLKINDEGLVVITDQDSPDDYEGNTNNGEQEEASTITVKPPRKTPKIIKKLQDLNESKPGLLERIANFMHLNNLWHKKSKNINPDQKNARDNPAFNEVNRVTMQGKKMEVDNETTKSKEETFSETKPILANDATIPYNYPVPIRPQSSSTTTTTTLPPPTSSPDKSNVVHLNTPKMLIPHVQQLARVTKIPPKKIEDFLASKPKLLQLANKVSRFPIGYDRTSPLEAQVMMAVQRAIEQDEDLKVLLSSAATLK